MKTANLLIGGILKSEHSKIHSWLRKTFGKANYCEFCCKPQKQYNYALKKGFNYEYKRNNYLQLCTSCHRKYDLTEELIEKHKQSLPSQKGNNKGLHPTAKKIIDIETGYIFETVSDAAIAANLKLSTLSMMLTGKNRNYTTLKYYEK